MEERQGIGRGIRRPAGRGIGRGLQPPGQQPQQQESPPQTPPATQVQQPQRTFGRGRAAILRPPSNQGAVLVIIFIKEKNILFYKRCNDCLYIYFFKGTGRAEQSESLAVGDSAAQAVSSLCKYNGEFE